MKKNKIAVDIDGVLAKTYEEFIEYINISYDTSFSIDEMTQYDMSSLQEHVSFSMYSELIEFMKQYMVHISSYEDAKSILTELKKDYELSILTARNDSFMDQTREWVEVFFGKNLFDSIHSLDYFEHECKSDVCKKLGFDILIDDAPHYAQKARDKEIKVLLFSQPWNKNIEECSLLKRVSNWREIKENL